MSDALIGYGTKYEIYQTSAFVEVAEVTAVTPGEATAGRVEVTHMLSPGRRREYKSGLIDHGEGSFEINWVPGGATDELLRGLFDSGETTQHRITWSNGVTLTFDAVVIGYAKEAPIDDRMTATITVAVSGEETWGEAA